MKETALEQITAPGIVEWQGVREHLAKSGKLKLLLSGTPTDAFWRIHNRAKADGSKVGWIREGISLFCLSRRKGTGEYRTFRGCQVEIKRSEWEVQVWINRWNRPFLAEKGFPVGLPDLDAPAARPIPEEREPKHVEKPEYLTAKGRKVGSYPDPHYEFETTQGRIGVFSDKGMKGAREQLREKLADCPF